MTAVISGFQWGVIEHARARARQDARQRRGDGRHLRRRASGSSAARSPGSRTRSDGDRDHRRGSLEAVPDRRAAERVRDPSRLAHRAALAELVRREHRPHYEEIWALRDVSFEVQEGDVLGIVGRNGAGKSTLLKILTRITTPTEGRATIRGRVGQPARGRHRLPSGADRARERLPERLRARDEAQGDRAQVPRHRRVRRRRAVHRHAGEALLERDVRPARLRGRRSSRARGPARRRGARRRRRRVPAPVPRTHGGPQPVRPDGDLRLAPDAGGLAALRPGDPAREGR